MLRFGIVRTALSVGILVGASTPSCSWDGWEPPVDIDVAGVLEAGSPEDAAVGAEARRGEAGDGADAFDDPDAEDRTDAADDPDANAGDGRVNDAPLDAVESDSAAAVVDAPDPYVWTE